MSLLIDETNVLSPADVRSRARLIVDKIVPLTTEQFVGPVVYALTAVLVSVARRAGWERHELEGFVGQMFDSRAIVEVFQGDGGQA